MLCLRRDRILSPIDTDLKHLFLLLRDGTPASSQAHPAAAAPAAAGASAHPSTHPCLTLRSTMSGRRAAGDGNPTSAAAGKKRKKRTALSQLAPHMQGPKRQDELQRLLYPVEGRVDYAKLR